MSAHDDRATHACAGSLDRRDFLRQATGFAAAVLVGLGAAPSVAQAMVREVRARETASPLAGRTREYAMPADDGALVDADNEVLLVRWAGRVHAFALACPHRGATLRWLEDAGTVFCPKHKARFSPGGANIGGRRTRALDRYPIRREGARIVVELTAPLEEDADATAWASAWIPVA